MNTRYADASHPGPSVASYPFIAVVQTQRWPGGSADQVSFPSSESRSRDGHIPSPKKLTTTTTPRPATRHSDHAIAASINARLLPRVHRRCDVTLLLSPSGDLDPRWTNAPYARS